MAIASVFFISWWIYPVAAIVIANRILALSLLCHEGLHATLHPNLKLNDFIGRYFCAFPTFISFSKYRRLHLLHHGTVGSEKWDPDRHLYAAYPIRVKSFVAIQLARLLTLRTLIDFFSYYTEFPEFFSRKRMMDGKLFVLSSRSDFPEFVVFHVACLALLLYFGFFIEYLLFVTLPMTLLTQPYVLLMGGLQHGPTREVGDEGVSRSIRGSKFYMWLLLPCDICYHAEHHLNASVPHYWLREFGNDLKSEGKNLWSASYMEALADLFAEANPGKAGRNSKAWLKREKTEIERKKA